MIQAIIKKGKVLPEETPAPTISKGALLIKVVNSCISAGTEMSGVTNSGKPLLKRALEQPAQVAKVINLARNAGVSKTIAKVKGTLDAGNPTGYSACGIVIGVGEGVNGYHIGDRVAAAGAGLANHAELINVPENLVCKIPDHLPFKEASTVTLGAIAMQGVRRADLRIGELCVVIGAGILGLLAIQMLRISGIRVAAIDLDEDRLTITKELGAELVLNPQSEDIVKTIESWTGGNGADAVLFTAATGSSEPLSQCFQMCKKKGRVVLVGVSGMQIKREDIYQKEIDFLISTSYGPGRYDDRYEQKGYDYPFAYVRWTENRNMGEYLRLLQAGSIKLDRLIQNTFSIQDVTRAYEELGDPEKKPLLVILDYGEPQADQLNHYRQSSRKVMLNTKSVGKQQIKIALVGAGGFATGMHLPNIKQLAKLYKLHSVMNRTGHKAKAVAQQYKAKYATTSYSDILEDTDVDLVLIATRHDSHGELVLQALEAGKNVFVEKPLATTQNQLDKIKDFYDSDRSNKPVLFTGFNRRFSRYAEEIKKHTVKRHGPLFIHYRMNAGFIPQEHWVHENGGRIVGECCHIIDLMTYYTEEKLESISVESLTPKNGKFSCSDNKSMILKYCDGSVCTIEYFAVGNNKYPKELMEVHFDEKTLVLDDYKQLKAYGLKVNEKRSSLSQKGQLEELQSLYNTLSGKHLNWPIELWDMIQTTEATFLLNNVD